ncbi:MAG: lytic murein transglycosylase [Filomicrobium sp.]
MSRPATRPLIVTVLIAATAAFVLPQAAHAECRNTGKFSTWMREFKAQARAEGVSERTISRALGGIKLDPNIIRRDRRQGFFAQSFGTFSKRLATNHRIKAGRKKIKLRRKYFDRAEQKYGVPPEVITGFWALESDFGAGMGKYSILRALATLAYDCRRKELFTGELMYALKILDKGWVRPSDMIGSWAGEMGQTQFLPKHYLEHAVDFDGDGTRNLFASDPDIIGSTAAFIKHLGWRTGEPWIEEVRVPNNLDWSKADLSVKLPRSQWAEWGVRNAKGGPLTSDSLQASLVLPMGRKGPAFLAYPNFDIYTQWNHSLSYCITAAYLATRISGKGGPMQGRDRDIPFLPIKEAKEVQRLLKRRGYDVGKVDGIIGAKTRFAVREMQLKYGLPADSYPTPELLRRLRR